MKQIIQFKTASMNKGEVADAIYPHEFRMANDVHYDCALPQFWLDKISRRFPDDQLESFGNLSSHFIYVYDNSGPHREEYIMPITKVGCKILGIVSLYA